MQMNNMAELITVQKYWRKWSDPRLIVCVLNNEDLGEVSWEQRATEGNTRFEDSQQLPNVPYSAFAELIGLRGLYVDRPEFLAEAWTEALTTDRPTVLEVKTDPNVPPMPPHITGKMAKALLSSISKGDKGALEALKRSLKGTLRHITA
jgi:pyruvate dehydrogenase (quinone)